VGRIGIYRKKKKTSPTKHSHAGDREGKERGGEKKKWRKGHDSPTQSGFLKDSENRAWSKRVAQGKNTPVSHSTREREKKGENRRNIGSNNCWHNF